MKNAADSKCLFSTCTNIVRSKGLCTKHYANYIYFKKKDEVNSVEDYLELKDKKEIPLREQYEALERYAAGINTGTNTGRRERGNTGAYKKSTLNPVTVKKSLRSLDKGKGK
ncbi:MULTISPECIES: hypothetical protein [Bacillus]|uniref:hypothetical protein n=1 Tax=Bacillus TaxID=1386 RepID=UPI000C782D3C|nr:MULTISPECIES: hypothetical protein [Bacillus]PLR72272.1 hypothetical protein CYJ37_12000 [Bacillus sp. UMB0728]RYI30563.1 hypothetical protein EVU96_09105 [Bacillus infantis]